MTGTNVMSIGQFNTHMGYKGRYAYQLAKEGRLVFAPDGKHVLVAESIKRIEATRDPSRQGVADRHAKERGYSVSTQGTPDNGLQGEAAANQGAASADSYQYQDAKAKKEHYAALREEAAYRKEMGELMDAGEVLGAFADAGAKVAGVLDALPATVGPMLVGQSQEEVMRILAEQMDIARAEMAAALNKLAAEVEERQKGAVQ